MKIAFYEVYGFKLSTSIVYTILETHAEEASSYLVSYITLCSVVMTLAYLGFCMYLVKYFLKNRSLSVLKKNRIVLLLLAIATILVVYRGFVYKKYNFVYTMFDALQSYKHTQNSFESKLTKHVNPAFKNVAQVSGESKTFVVIIGESTTRRQMGLYGFYRETNPLLSAKKKQLKVYDSVVSTSAYTIFSLNQILLHKKDYITPQDHFEDKDVKGSLVQLANMAGFETYWISNQRPIGINETSTSKIARAANKTVFVNYEDYDFESYDEKVLPELDKVLSESPKYKMIFIHLMGAHWNFKYRYPKAYNKFTTVPQTPIKDKDKQQIINEYHNAILYNDFIVNSVIDKVAGTQTESYVTYFSDHGVDVFENVTKGVQHSDRNPTKPMYEIPFIVWMSESYESNVLIDYKPQRKYVMSDFIHSFSELSSIKFDEYDDTKSIFNANYIFDKTKVENTRLEHIIYD
ncbi:MAG: sulfatase-like hydrolase/transferase [Flavobacteriaceae bacterium]